MCGSARPSNAKRRMNWLFLFGGRCAAVSPERLCYGRVVIYTKYHFSFDMDFIIPAKPRILFEIKKIKKKTQCEHRFFSFHSTDNNNTITQGKYCERKFKFVARMAAVQNAEKKEKKISIIHWCVAMLFFHSCVHYDFFFIIIFVHLNCLRFSVPPDRISIKDESGAERTSVVGPYSEGDTINLYCEVFGGKYSTFSSWLLLLPMLQFIIFHLGKSAEPWKIKSLVIA